MLGQIFFHALVPRFVAVRVGMAVLSAHEEIEQVVVLLEHHFAGVPVLTLTFEVR